MTAYMRLRALARWRQEQGDVLALLGRFSGVPWTLAPTADGIGQIVRVGRLDHPLPERA